MNSLARKILLGVTGGVASYKSAEIIRLLKKLNVEVKVIMTRSALEFIRPLTFATLSENPVYTKMFEQHRAFNCEHIELAKWADLILIAPATANIIAKLAYGIADDLLTTVCLACEKPIYLAPAMNKVMWAKEITQANVAILEQRGMKILYPEYGRQACGDIGLGRMLEPQTIVNAVLNTKGALLKDKKIMITAGPTIEPIDPVRFISNYSSGKMGYAIVNAAVASGAEVTLISGPTNLAKPHGCKYIPIKTAAEMHDAVLENIKQCDIFIAAAAVADYRAEKIATQKIKRAKNKLQLNLVKNPDILTIVAALDKSPFTVGFAAETENLENNAMQKLQQKGIDIIAANLVGDNCGFNKDENSLLLISKNGRTLKLQEKDKLLLAYELLEFISSILYTKPKCKK